jgi:spore maturation protein CgeB
MIAAGWSPSVRLFEAAACGTPIVSDAWAGLDELLVRDTEILIVETADQVLASLRTTTERERRSIGARARARVLAAHTAAHRAEQLEGYVRSVMAGAAST